MIVETTDIDGVLIITPKVFYDERGSFREVWDEQLIRLGIPPFVQLNHSYSKGPVVRGLHFQLEPPMGKLMRVTNGEAFLVAVDVKIGSPTFGKWVGITTDSRDGKQLWAPAHFARGFSVLGIGAGVEYACTASYNEAEEQQLLWNDPDVGIAWPIKDPMVSEKDKNAITLREWYENNNTGS